MHSRKRRLLMAIPHPDAKGGPPTHIPLLVEYFRESSTYDVKTFYYGSKLFGTDRGQKETAANKVIVTLGKLFEFLYLLAIFRPHVIHLSTAFTKLAILRDLPFAIVSRLFRKKLILKLHGCHLDLLYTEDRFQIRIIHWLFWGTTKIGVLSRAEQQEIIQRFGYAEKLVLTKNIVPPADVIKPSDLVERQFGATYGLFVSRIEKLKGLQDLIRALPGIRKAVPDFRLVVAGDGPDKANCEELTSQLNLSNSVIWLGYVDNHAVQSLYRQCDVFVFPTHYPEGMPMVLVEALNSGIPIVTTPVWFGLSYLKDGENCVYVERGNQDDLSRKIVNLIRSSSLQSTMRRENPALVDQFGKMTVGQEFEEIYECMLESR